jgi:hypothetical protein
MRKLIPILALCVLISGCASRHMQPAVMQADSFQLADNQSALVFYRDSSFGGAIQAPIVEAIGGDIVFVGIVSSGAKILHKTTPGKHYYVVGGESSNLLEANLEPGKFYYARVNPKIGMWKARFSLDPVSGAQLNSESTTKDIASCAWYVSKPEALTWFADNKQSMLDKSDEAFKKNESVDRSERSIINPGDGTAVLIR